MPAGWRFRRMENGQQPRITRRKTSCSSTTAMKKEVMGTVNVGKVVRLAAGLMFPPWPDSSKLYVMTAGGPCTEGCPGNVVVVDVAKMKMTSAGYKVANGRFRGAGPARRTVSREFRADCFRGVFKQDFAGVCGFWRLQMTSSPGEHDPEIASGWGSSALSTGVVPVPQPRSRYRDDGFRTFGNSVNDGAEVTVVCRPSLRRPD